MKKLVLLGLASIILATAVFVSINYFSNEKSETTESVSLAEESTIMKASLKEKKKTVEEKRATVEQREQFEFDMQKNPETGVIPREEKDRELQIALEQRDNLQNSEARAITSTFETRGPTNLGGRTRSLAVDLSDPTGNTMLAGAVSGGMFRTTNGGASWTKVSENDEIHNVSAIAQDPRVGFQNIWYYGTGEVNVGSNVLGTAYYYGQGIWQSTDSGVTWTQISSTNSPFETFTTVFDFINSLAVSPTTGELFVAAFGVISRYDGVNFNTELAGTNTGYSDVKVTSTGRVFAAFPGNNATLDGVHTSPTGNGSWTRISQNGTPATPVGWSAAGRTVLGIAPSNPNIVYALYVDGTAGIEADLWRWDQSTTTWTDYSSKLPDEAGGDLAGNDPFAVQGGYDLEVSVKPNDEDMVVIGGTNVYRIFDIVTDPEFLRIGGYENNASYALYDLGGGDTHHPDIQDLVFSPFDSDLLISGTDGGIHTADITDPIVGWTSLNNSYQTYQYYHVALDPQSGSDLVMGGAQDNGTTAGGNNAVTGLTNTTDMISVFGGDGVAASIGRTGTNTNTTDVQLYFGAQLGTLFAFRGGFTNIQPTGTSSSIFVTYFYLDTENNALYYVDGGDVHRTTDAPNVTAGTWTNIGGLTSLENIRSITTTPGTYNAASSYNLVGGQNGGVFKHLDPLNTNLNTASNITPAGASTASNSVVSGVAIHPTNPDIAMVVYSNYGINNIYLSTNMTSGSPSWTLVERNLASHSIRSVAITEASGEIGYFVGTGRGLYSSGDPTTTDWTLEGVNDVGLAIISGLVYRPADNKLLVGTHGNGMYLATISSTLSVESFEGKGNLTLYPNPATTDISFNLGDDSFSDVGYSIFDLTGKKISTGVLSSERKIDVERLKTGIYIVELKSGNKISTGKFVKK